MFPIDIKSLNEQERHDYILKTYVINKEQSAASRKQKRDIDIIKENHRFLWENTEVPDSWEKQLARKYYDKLFKEYCISDLSFYKDNKVALRWRIESEVISGKGQFQCGNRKCDQREGLKSWEVNFAYLEEGQRKNALVKLRLCPEHSQQLNYTSRKKEVKQLKQTKKLLKKSKRNKGKRKKDNIEYSSGNEDKCTDGLEKSKKDFGAKRRKYETVRSVEKEGGEETIRGKKFESYLEDLLL